jgi:hypothetical protein
LSAPDHRNARFRSCGPSGPERSGSRESIHFRVRPPVSRGTVCSLGQPNKAVGHESPIEPWLARLRRPQSRTNSRAAGCGTRCSDGRRSGEDKHRRVGSEGAGCTRKQLSREEKCFLLTSPFIEPEKSSAAPLGTRLCATRPCRAPGAPGQVPAAALRQNLSNLDGKAGMGHAQDQRRGAGRAAVSDLA